MTNNPTIDGVSLELLANFIEYSAPISSTDQQWHRDKQALRALLDAPVVERRPVDDPLSQGFYTTQSGGGHYSINIGFRTLAEMQAADKQLLDVLRDRSEVAALQSTIAQLQARIAELKGGQGEPVAYADPIAFENFKNHAHKGGHWDHEWMWAKPDSRMVPLFTAPPAPVAVVLPPFAEKVISKLRRCEECFSDFESCGVDIGRHWLDLLTQLGLLNRVQRSPAMWGITQQGEDCLDATAAPNEVRK